MFLEEYSLDTADVFWPTTAAKPNAQSLPAMGSLLGCGLSLFFGSSLFAASSLRRKTVLEKAQVFMLGSRTQAFYSGERLDQFDLDVFLDCLLDAQLRQGQTGSLPDVLRRLGRKNTQAHIERLKASLFRLARGRIELFDERFSVSVQLLDSVLIDHKRKSFRAYVSKETKAALGSHAELANLHRVRLALKQRPLAKWLSGLALAALDHAHVLEQADVAKLCGREHTESGLFAVQLQTALNSLYERGYIQPNATQQENQAVDLKLAGPANGSSCRLNLMR